MMAVQLGVAILFLVQFAQGYPYPTYTDKRYQRTSYRPAYVPLPMPYSMSQGYDDAQQEMSQSYLPYYYYYPYRSDRRINYYDDLSGMNDGETDQMTYPFGQEMWYEGGNDNVMSATATASAAAAREAILQNLIIAQMYEDAAANAAVSGFPIYKMQPEEYENKDWKYGVPTTGVEENERARQYLKNEEDEEVKELENLRKAKEATKESKRRRKQKDKAAKAGKDHENEIKEAMGYIKRQEMLLATARPVLTESILSESAAVGRKTTGSGQKEVVLPLPARPSRQPFAELTQRLHIRSEEPSVYQTIKQLLALENDYKKTDESRVQKRFVSNEEQLTQQLRGLKKSTL